MIFLRGLNGKNGVDVASQLVLGLYGVVAYLLIRAAAFCINSQPVYRKVRI